MYKGFTKSLVYEREMFGFVFFGRWVGWVGGVWVGCCGTSLVALYVVFVGAQGGTCAGYGDISYVASYIRYYIVDLM